MRRLFIYLFTTFALTGFACSIFTPGGQSESLPPEATQDMVIIEPTTTPLPTQTPLPQPAFEATTYRDDQAGFEFDYPVGWTFDPGEHQSRGYYVQFYSWDWQPGDPIDPLPEGGTVFSITVQLWDPKNDLEAFINQRKLAWDSSGTSILSEERLTLAGDRPAAQFVVQGVDGSQAFFLLTTNGEDYLVLSGNGDLSLLAEIVKTLRPIQ
jgi:hypothetical protein